jgi:hypothetical protein
VALTLPDPPGTTLSHTIGGAELRAERVGLIVAYAEAVKRVYIYRTDPTVATAELVGEWPQDSPFGWGTTPPSVFLASVGGRMFFAHDTPLTVRRAPTMVYDTVGGAGLEVLEEDLDGSGDWPVRFRGVVGHRGYLFGWGFNAAREEEHEDRPELVRVSRPGEPREFERNSYFVVGDRRDPVTRCIPAGAEQGSRLLVFKETKHHVITGHDKASFGVFELDELHGLLAPHLAVGVNGLVHFFAPEGPRVSDGQNPSVDTSLDLDLRGFEPTDWVAKGEDADAFATYLPIERVVGFVFGQRMYPLTVRIDGAWQWGGIWTLPFEPRTAFTIAEGPLPQTAPTGHPRCAGTAPGGTFADVTTTNVGQDGNEFLEAWVQPFPAGPWALSKTVPVTTGLFNQTLRLDGLTPGLDYEVALRYRRGPFYTEGYEDADPSNWPSISRCEFTTSVDPPDITDAAWERLDGSNEQITLDITPADTSIDIIVSAQGRGDLGTISAPHGGSVQFIDDTGGGLAGEVWTLYNVRHDTGPDAALSGAFLQHALGVWSGPTWPPGENSFGNPGGPVCYPGAGRTYLVRWDELKDQSDLYAVQVSDSFDDGGGANTTDPLTTVRGTTASPALRELAVTALPAGAVGKVVQVAVRGVLTAFTVDDFTPYDQGSVLIQT